MADTLTQLDGIRTRQLEGFLRAEQHLRQAAEAQAAAARQALHQVAMRFCAAELDAVQRERKAEVQRWTAKQLGAFILDHTRHAAAPGTPPAPDDALQGQIESLQQALAGKEHQIEALREQIQQLEQALSAARADLSATRQRLEAPPAIEPPPRQVVASPGPWFDAWQAANGYERSRDVLHLLGDSGACRRPALEAQASERWEVKTRRAFDRSVRLLHDHGLIEVQDAPSLGQRGRPPQLLTLTEQGRRAFLILFNKEAAPSELDELLKRHKTLAHTLLNLDAADALRDRLGARVDLYPPPLSLEGGRRFAPDLVATLSSGDVIYVECERGTAPAPREQKWRNVYDATGGTLYVICPDAGSRSKVVAEINRWAGTRPIALRATDLATLSRRASGFWFYDRSRGR